MPQESRKQSLPQHNIPNQISRQEIYQDPLPMKVKITQKLLENSGINKNGRTNMNINAMADKYLDKINKLQS